MDKIDTDDLRRIAAEATPGPWAFETEAEPEFDYPCFYVCSPETVCDVTVVATMGTALTIPEARKIADARLIALAPDLAAEVLQLREVLRPFAAIAEHDIGDDEADGDAFRPMQFLNHAPKLTVGDLRRARAALSHPASGEGAV